MIPAKKEEGKAGSLGPELPYFIADADRILYQMFRSTIQLYSFLFLYHVKKECCKIQHSFKIQFNYFSFLLLQ